MTKQFQNEAKAIDVKLNKWHADGEYGFDAAPRLLFQWGRLFQAVISQCCTYALTGKFHSTDFGIYKCEGGCHVQDIGELVLTHSHCYFDGYGDSAVKKRNTERCAALITAVVLGWDPNDPIKSMLSMAADAIGVPVESLEQAIATKQNIFCGDALSRFFNWNPFMEPPYDPEYRRYCLVNILGENPTKVDRLFADEQLGKELLGQINDKLRSNQVNSYGFALCCSPRREDDNTLIFWINTGRSTQIDGWQTEQQIAKFLKSDGRLVDTARY